MPSNHVNRVLRNSEAVSRRAEESRKEIEVLRAEYERLLERGLQAGTSNITDTDKEKEILNKKEEREIGNSSRTADSIQASSSHHANGDVSEIPRMHGKRKSVDKSSLAGDTARTALDQGSPPKVRHYRVEDAREYIRKQRERRLQQQKQLKETDNFNELKKQKLKDLHQKSLQIVARNRQRSKSREKQKVDDVELSHLNIPESTQNTVQGPFKKVTKALQQQPQLSAATATTKQNVAIVSTANITFRDQLNDLKYVKSSAKSDDAKIKAATLIQAYFRGHIQRRLYKYAIMQRINKQKQLELQKVTTKQMVPLNDINPIVEEPTNARESEKKIPDWLQIEPTYHPYNFINSVKRKLNVALNTPVKTSDIGIQSSFSDHFQVASQDKVHEETPTNSHRYKDIKEKIEISLSSKKSERELNAKIERSLDEFRNIQREVSKQSSKHSSEKYTNIFEKTTNNGHTHDKGFLNLDVKRLENLRLQSEHSDSDTSKNIPDISIESRLKSSTASISTLESHSHTSVFKPPREAPPKPKRLSRHDVHTSLAKFSGDSESQKFAKHAQEHLDEYKLDINVDRIKDIKLRMRLNELPLQLEQTSSKSKHLRKSNGIETHDSASFSKQNKGSTSSINTMSHSHSLRSQTKDSQQQSNNEEKFKNATKSTSHVSSIAKINSNADDSSISVSSKESHRSHTKASSSHTHSLTSDTVSDSVNSQKVSKNSRRDSTISGNITRYTKSFNSYNSINSKVSEIETLERSTTTVDGEGVQDDTANITENLLSFRQYMKEMDDTHKITHTPFQPMKNAFRSLNAETRLQEVISKVNMLDMSRNIANSSSHSSKVSISSQHNQELGVFNISDGSVGNIKNGDREVLEERNEVIGTSDMLESGEVEGKPEELQEEHNGEVGLKAPAINLLVMKCSDIKEDKDNKISARASADTLTGSTNQIHVKFEAEIHMLNDFNESLKHVMNIEKSMLELQTKYNLQPAVQQTKDTQTSIMTSTSTTKLQQNASNTRSSIIEQSINFSRGSDIEDDIGRNSKEDKVIVLHENKNLKIDTTGSNSTLNITDILNDSNNSLLSKQNAITANTTAKSLNSTDMVNVTASRDKLSSVGVSVGMFDELIRDEDARIDNLKTELKIREKALLDRTKAELTWLEIQKKHLLETGKLHEASLLKKKQRGIILKLQEEKNEMQRLREAQKAASRERKTKLKEQRALIKAQLSGPHLVTRIRRASERRASGPVKVYQSEYYQSETSISRKSSAESVVYSASIVSRGPPPQVDADEDVNVDVATDVEHAPPAAVTSCTEMAKRSLQMREAALQRRKKEAEELLRWHRRLLREERKIADLEMAASNVINQVPVTTTAADGGGGDKYTFKVGAVVTPHMIWKSQPKNDGDVAQKTSKAKAKQTLESGADASMSSKYSTEFDTETDKCDGVVEEESIPQSESTLNEIMQNINNITDEISELYKLSSMQKSQSDADTTIKSDNLPTDDSQTDKRSRSSKASIISKPKTVPDETVTNVEIITQDRELSEPDIPDVSNESRKSIICIDSKELSLHEVQLPDPAETEDDISSIKSDVIFNEESKSLNINISTNSTPEHKEQDINTVTVDISDASDTLIETNVGEDVEQIKSDESSELSNDVKLSTAEDIVCNNAVDFVSPEMLTQTYIVSDEQLDTSKIEEPQSAIEDPHISLQSEGNILISHEGSVVEETNLPSSKDVSIDNEQLSDLEIADNVDISLAEFVESEDLITYQLPSSQVDTLIEVPEPNVKITSVSEVVDDVNNISENDQLKDDMVADESDEIQDALIRSAITVEEAVEVTEVSTDSRSVDEQKIDSISFGNDDVEEMNTSEYESNSEQIDEIEVESNEIELRVSDEEFMPIIGVKIEEKKQLSKDDAAESHHSLCLDSPTKEDDHESTKEVLKEGERTIIDEKYETSVMSTKPDIKNQVNVKKRVSEILADANLNASIEEKSPRLPDIYVTTYDVISPENSPELGSPVDNSKAKPKDIYGIGNEAQELLKKQLAIEQEIKQIERQQKEQLPYIFVREIPNKPPPPYTPPVQQPTSIIPATSAQIDEIAPHLAEIFHRGFVEKTLEYITFPDTKLGQHENVDKICAEFLFDIAKEYAVDHYRQFVEPDEKAPSWMKHNKPKSFKRPHAQASLEDLLKKKLKQLFAFEKSDLKESMIIKWSRRKRDHVDELLVVESQSEEAEWTNYDLDELLVKEEVTTGLLDMLIEETAICLQQVFAKRQAI